MLVHNNLAFDDLSHSIHTGWGGQTKVYGSRVAELSVQLRTLVSKLDLFFSAASTIILLV